MPAKKWPEPRYARVFQMTEPQNGQAVYALFPAAQDGSILKLADDNHRELFFQLSQGLVAGVLDMGTRLVCANCPHILHQHADVPLTQHAAPAACRVPDCRCLLWEPSDCRCYQASGGKHVHSYTRICFACRTRWGHLGNPPYQYDDTADRTLPAASRQN